MSEEEIAKRKEERREEEREDSNDTKTYYKHYLVLRYVRIHLVSLGCAFFEVHSLIKLWYPHIQESISVYYSPLDANK